MQAQNIIVIHPGSMYLRIGRASDLYPSTLLHAIGKRRKKQDDSQSFHRDSLLPALLSKDKHSEVNGEFEKQRLHIVSHAIPAYAVQHQVKSATCKRLRVSTPLQQISTFNKLSEPEIICDNKGISDETKKERSDNETIFDGDIMKLSAQEANNYNIHFPFRRGELNVHSGIGGSLTAVLTDLETIWLYAIHKHMGIPPSSMTHFGAVLIISDIYNRSILKEMVTLLLKRLRFRACFLVQDHVAATFGAGLGYACVVDVGDQKCSISCVEDGISQVDTRVRLGYGGGDVTQVFFCLLQKCSFPYKDCDVHSDYGDAVLIMHLKERLCHLNLEICGAQEKNFEVQKELRRLHYTFQLGDECIVAPLALFHTELLNVCGRQRIIRLQLRSSQQPDSEDCFDAEYIRETGRVRNGRCDQLLEGAIPITNDTADEDLVAADTFDADERLLNARNSDNEEQLYYTTSSGDVVPLDLAIVRSIERCTSDDMKRKMYGCILVVGGGSKLNGFVKWLEQKIALQLAASTANHHRNHDATSLDVNVCVKEMDAAMTAWKGGAIMSCLESSPEVWIHSAEWEKYGLRILREKATFIW